MLPDCTPTKTCTKCGRQLPATTEYFGKHNAFADGLDNRCRPCRRSHSRAVREKNPEKYRTLNRASYHRNHADSLAAMKATKRRRQIKSRAVYEEFRGRGCQLCGCSEPLVIQAHHRDPDGKDSNLRRNGELLPVALMVRELEKCVPLCANCHILAHRLPLGSLPTW